jgi:hypothetical protein
MEIVGGFMVMMSIIGLFLAVVWLVMPFVVFAIKGKQDRTLEILEAIERRLAALEAAAKPVGNERYQDRPSGDDDASAEAPSALGDEHTTTQTDPVIEMNGQDAPPPV